MGRRNAGGQITVDGSEQAAHGQQNPIVAQVNVTGEQLEQLRQWRGLEATSPEPNSAGVGKQGLRKVHNRFSNFESYENSVLDEPTSGNGVVKRAGDGHSDPQPARVAVRRQPP